MAIAESDDVARGARVYQRCYACHSVDPNEKAMLQGPSLYQVIGRRAASVAGFSYSPAMIAKGEAGLVWTEDELDQFLLDPERAVPGNQMDFFGLPDARDRADLIAYLKNAARGALGITFGASSKMGGRSKSAPIFSGNYNELS